LNGVCCSSPPSRIDIPRSPVANSNVRPNSRTKRALPQ